MHSCSLAFPDRERTRVNSKEKYTTASISSRQTIYISSGPFPDSHLFFCFFFCFFFADKSRDFIGKGCLGREQEGKETQDCWATWFTVSVFYGDKISFLVVSAQLLCLTHTLLSQGGCQRGFWEVVGYVESPFDLSWILSVCPPYFSSLPRIW